jgi:hypothetical protein
MLLNFCLSNYYCLIQTDSPKRILLKRCAVILNEGMTSSTLKQYERSIKPWKAFVALERLTCGLTLEGLSNDYVRIYLILYVGYLHKQLNYSESAINIALSGLQHLFRIYGKDTSSFRDPVMSIARKSCRVTDRQKNITRENKKRLPVTMDMLKWLQEHYWKSDIDESMVCVASMLAFHFMLRASEYVPHPKNPHSLMSEDIIFITNDQKKLRPNKVSPEDNITMMILMIRSSKRGALGSRYLHLSRSHPEESVLLDMMIHWCHRSGATSVDPVFCRYSGGHRKLLIAKEITNALRCMAVAKGMNPKRFSSHSLRIGGVTTMMAAGSNRDMIRRVGGFSSTSNCDAIYDRNTKKDHGALSTIPGKGKILSSHDILELL